MEITDKAANWNSWHAVEWYGFYPVLILPSWPAPQPPHTHTWLSSVSLLDFLFFKKRFYLLIFRERVREGEREEEKHQCVVTSHARLTGDLASHPGMCPDWELNWWPFGSQASAQSTELHQPVLFFFIKWKIVYIRIGRKAWENSLYPEFTSFCSGSVYLHPLLL